MVQPGLTDLFRNSTATVLSHTGETCLLQTHAGSHNAYSASGLYPLTGTEKPPLPERTPDLRRCPRWLKELALKQTGGELRLQEPEGELEGPELAAGWQELGFR